MSNHFKYSSFIIQRSLFVAFLFLFFNAHAQTTVVNVSNANTDYTGLTGSWTVPSGGSYLVHITVKGAKGGAANNNSVLKKSGGNGAVMVGDFTVSSGQILEYDAGAAGQDFNSSGVGGGGGGAGSGVRIQGGALLILAGGGGGGGVAIGGGTAQSTPSGGSGNGGAGYDCGGGGGLNTAGATVGGNRIGGGAGFNAGPANGTSVGGGGFCGGGSGSYGGGGGGGYTGGDSGNLAQNSTYGGGGGTSYNTGTNQLNGATVNNGAGQVLIELYTLAATLTPTQPTCSIATGNITVNLTGDYNGNNTALEYAIVAGNSFTITPTFTDFNADPLTVTGLATGNNTVRVRLKNNPTVYKDYSFAITPYVPGIHIPDPIFVSAIRSACYNCLDACNNLTAAAASLQTLDVPAYGINDLTGINGFTGLKTLDCAYNSLK